MKRVILSRLCSDKKWYASEFEGEKQFLVKRFGLAEQWISISLEHKCGLILSIGDLKSQIDASLSVSGSTVYEFNTKNELLEWLKS